MRHARPATIASLDPLLERLRAIPRLKEVKPGIFYHRSRAFLHFHEHADEIYADVRLEGKDFDRLPCSSRGEQEALVEVVIRHLDR